MNDSSPITRLYDRLSRKIEQGKSIQLSAEDLDWFVLCGGYKAVALAAEAHAFAQVRARVEVRGEHLEELAELVAARKLSSRDGSNDPPA